MSASHASESIRILEKLVSFDTVSHRSNLPIIEWIEAYLDQHGVAHERFPDATGQKASLLATIGPTDRPGYILSGHTDVVPVEGQAWSSDPFTLTLRDGRAYGRGAADMKGFLACCLAAVPAMTAASLTTPIHIAFSYDEEIGCVGVQPMLRELAARNFEALGCFVGEPTNHQVIIGHKGKQSLRCDIRGLSCHSSRAPEGVNTVEYGARLVAFIHEIGARLRSKGPRDGLYDIPFTTGQTSVFHGGTAVNIIPNHASFDFEFRVIGADDRFALIDEVRRYASEVLEPEMKAVHPDASITFTILSDAPTLDTAPEAPTTTLAKKLAGRNDHAKVAFGTEAALFASIAGIESVVVGPGSIEQAHKPDEWIELSELAACDAFIAKLIAHCAA